jgi:UDP:flavonoid glycosyltransferase YjiC (YdhE family)
VICLFPHCAYLSETSRMTAVYRALVARGASVCVATHGGTHEFYLREAGVPYRLLEPTMSPERCRRFVSEGAGQGPANQSFYSDDELRGEVAAQVRFFRQNGVKAVLTGFALTTLLSTRVAGIPLAASHAGSCVPPLFERGIMPAPSRNDPAWLDWLPEPWLRRLSNWAVQRLPIHCSGFNRVARELGVDGVPSFAALVLGDLTLVTDVPELVGISAADLAAWTPKRPASYRPQPKLRYVGPIFANEARPIPERVERFLAERGSAPVVYVALTSTDRQVVEASIRAVRKTGARVVAVSTVHELRILPDDGVCIEAFLPSLQLMPQVDLAVTAGGQGSVQTAMSGGTPLLGIPLQPEQDLNLHLIERQGAGKLLPLRLAGSVRMTEWARQMLHDPSYRRNARRVQALLSAVDGPGNAAELMLRLASGGIQAV